jgi:hypothetical protein
VSTGERELDVEWPVAEHGMEIGVAYLIRAARKGPQRHVAGTTRCRSVYLLHCTRP